jgi:drug/metabolite transporter (DMT)-like permease
MNEYYLLMAAGIFACSASQLLLKKSATMQWRSRWAFMLNWRVIVAYGIFFCSLMINLFAMHKGVNLKDMPILESLGYVFVPLLSYVFLKERISRRMVVSILLILAGIYVFYL